MRWMVLVFPRWRHWFASWPTAARVLAVSLAAFVGLAGWAVSSPVGSSPDDDYHLASIWCAPGAGCESTPEGMMVPAAAALSDCYAHNDQESGACQGTSFDVRPVERIPWTRGNYEQHLYPGGFYSVLHVFAGDDITLSVTLMRLFNAAILVTSAASLWCALPLKLRPVLVWPLLVTSMPLAAFIIPSTNPSSWAFIAAYLTLPAFAGYLTTTGKRRVALGVIASAAALLGSMARADAAGFAVLAFMGAFALVRPRGGQRSWGLVVAVPSSLVALALALTAGQVHAATDGLTVRSGPGGFGAVVRSMVHNAPQVLDLVQGALGGWGLGWLDTAMPQWVSVTGLLILGAVIVGGLRRAPINKVLVAATFAAAVVAYPLVVLAQSNAAVGGYFQPRYLFPLLILMVAAVVFPASVNALQLTRGQAVALWAVLSGSALVAQYALLRRFVTGVDARWFSLDNGVEWWGGPATPMTVWIVSSVAFSIVVAALASHLTERQHQPCQPAPGQPRKDLQAIQ